MTSIPLRSVAMTDFRRLEGPSRFPLDAPIVLVHGPNGAGKTSLLSAIELALTGEIRSMRRHDDRYTAHLATHGQDFATIEIEVADASGELHRPGRMTVGGSRIEGEPAFSPAVAKFYGERSYLDQSSLGQLLDLYQYREGKEESALARFVNEMLGLDQLDALQEGLSSTTHVARMRKLSKSFSLLESEAESAEQELSKATAELSAAQAQLSSLHARLRQSTDQIEAETASSDLAEDTSALVQRALRMTDSEETRRRSEELRHLSQAIAGTGGQVRSLLSRPASNRHDAASVVLAAQESKYQEWRDSQEPLIDALEDEALELGLKGSGPLQERLATEVAAIEYRLAEHETGLVALTAASTLLTELQATDEQLDGQVKVAEANAGSLASGLAALRQEVEGSICPVCDRDFSEVSSSSLASHLEQKIDAITQQGRELETLRAKWSSAQRDLQETERRIAGIEASLLGADEVQPLADRRQNLIGLRDRSVELGGAIQLGQELRRNLREAKDVVAEIAAATAEETAIREALASHALALGLSTPLADAPLEPTWRELTEAVARSEAMTRELLQAQLETERLVELTIESKATVEALRRSVTESASRKLNLAERMDEVSRRRSVARTVHDAASATRASIVQRVFTESLNEVWADVFSRLAPREPFVPAFGIPKLTKNALELRLETTHPSGEAGGPPSLMLSSGNLNTAALSLFIALHLAVDPLVPCMVFDDPVQSMDEVHIAQFAGLLRVLSKHHERQIVVAVHERELFEYLSLELSPAYEGDELITIELGNTSGYEDGIRRITWSPDRAIAI